MATVSWWRDHLCRCVTHFATLASFLYLKRVPFVSNVTSFRSELKQLFHLMLPILITQFAQAGFGLIDTIMAGHLSATDLAAIAVGVGLWIPVMLLFSGIMIATTPLVAGSKGRKKYRTNSCHCPSILMGRHHFRRNGYAHFAAHAIFLACVWSTREPTV